MPIGSLDFPGLYELWGKIEQAQPLKREGRPPIENLVCEGGGVKGVVYAGALEVMEENGILQNIKRVAGSSVGGIVSMLLAVGYTAKEIKKILVEEINFATLMGRRFSSDPSRVFKVAGMDIGVSDLTVLFKYKGLYKGDAFVELLKMLVSRKIEEKFKALVKEINKKRIVEIMLAGEEAGYSPANINKKIQRFINHLYEKFLDQYYIDDLSNITFSQLKKLNKNFPQLQFKELYITGTKLSDSSLKVFSADTDPDMSIIDSVRITMSFPFGFEPVLYQGEYYSDGGIADNYPMSIFDQEKFLVYGVNDSGVNPCTIGLLVDSQDEIDERWGVKRKSSKKDLDIEDFMGGIFKGLGRRGEVLKKQYDINSIQIFDEGVKTMNFNMSDLQKKRLLNAGRKSMQHYLDNYFGTKIKYSHLPEYEDIYAKYYSMSVGELILKLEEIWSLIQETHTFETLLDENYNRNTLLNIRKKLSQYPVKLIKAQEKIINKLQILMHDFDTLKVNINKIDIKIKELEKEKFELWNKIDNLKSYDRTPIQIGALYNKQKEIIEGRKILRLQSKEKSDEWHKITRKINIIKKLVNKNILELLSKKDTIEYICKNQLCDKLKKSEMILHEQMDIILDAIRAHGEKIPDPRITSNVSHDLFYIKSERLKMLIRMYRNERGMDIPFARIKAIEHNDFIEDLIQYGVSINEAILHSKIYFATIDILMEEYKKLDLQKDDRFELINSQNSRIKNEERNKIYEMILVSELAQLELLFLETQEVDEAKMFWRKTLYEYLLNKKLSFGYAASLAKERTIQKWKSRKLKLYVPQDEVDRYKINLSYAVILSKTISRLSAGKWKEITFANRGDIIHNLKYVRYRGKESYGRHESNYSVVTLKGDAGHYKSLTFKKEYDAPPIIAHILKPSKEAVQNVTKPIKEIIIAFGQPLEAKNEHHFCVTSKYSYGRRKYFNECKLNILKQLKWALRQIRDQEPVPPTAKYRITIAGEGLAGQDAQYMFLEIIEELIRNGNQSDLKNIIHLDLLLVDPTRVSSKVAKEAADKVHQLKQKRHEIQISGYNLIHQVAFGSTPLYSLPQNYVGEQNILSHILPEEGIVIADFSDVNDSLCRYRTLSNQTGKQPLRRSLNRNNLLFSSEIYRNINLRGRQLGKISADLCLKYLPNLVKFLIRIPFNIGKNIIQKLRRPLKRFLKVFKTTKKIEKQIPPWSKYLSDVSRFFSIHDDETNMNYSWVDQTRSLMQKSNLQSRLAREKRPPIENLVFEGGGMNCCVYAGALAQMEQHGLLRKVKRVAGNSAGAIAATLFAVGFNPNELIDVITNKIDYKALLDEPLSLGGIDTFYQVGGIEIGFLGFISLFKNKGLYKGNAFKQIFSKLIERKMEDGIKDLIFSSLSQNERMFLQGIPPVLSSNERDKRIDQFLDRKLALLKREYHIDSFGKITFRQLKGLSKDFPELNIKELFVTGTHLASGTLKIFSCDSEPDMQIVDALRISLSFPGGFVPIKHKGEYYVDGSIANNYPMHIFDEEKFLTHGLNASKGNPCTLGLLADSNKEIDARWGRTSSRKNLSFTGFAVAVLKSLHRRTQDLRDKYNINSIQIYDEGAKATDIDLSRRTKNKLIQSGKDAIYSYYQNYISGGVGYSHLPPYDNLMQKYFPKSSVELTRIMEDEILPLLSEFERLEPIFEKNTILLQKEIDELNQDLHSLSVEEVRINKLKIRDEKEKLLHLIALAKRAKNNLNDEYSVLLKAMKSKGMAYPKQRALTGGRMLSFWPATKPTTEIISTIMPSKRRVKFMKDLE